MVEQETRVDRLVSIDVVERFEALQDEVDLMKNEIKQTLVDMREFMMRDRTVFSQSETEPRRVTPSSLPPKVAYVKEPPAQTGTGRSIVQKPIHSNRPLVPVPQLEGMHPLMLGKIIQWLGTVQEKGLSLHQVTPFLEAYEDSGYLTPVMAKLLLRSLADLDNLTDSPSDEEFSPERYAECIGELHDILCAVYETEEQAVGPIEASLSIGPEAIDQAEQMDDESPEVKLNGHSLGDTAKPDTSGYKLTTIQDPSLQENQEDQEDGNLNG